MKRIVLLVVAIAVVLVTVAAKPAPSDEAYLQAEISAIIDTYIGTRFGPAHDATAVCVSRAEDPRRAVDAVSRTNDHGLFQIHVDYGGAGRLVGSGRWRRYFTIRQLHTLEGNVRAALILSNHGQQWYAWTGTYGRGLCHNLS